jgi:hypothetical protein
LYNKQKKTKFTRKKRHDWINNLEKK